MTVTSLSFSSSSRARFQPTLPAPQTITYIASSALFARAGDGLVRVTEGGPLELVDRDRGRADRVQPLLGIPRGAPRVEHADDHLGHLEAPLRQLRDDEIRVVAPRRRDEDVGLVDAGLHERIDL